MKKSTAAFLTLFIASCMFTSCSKKSCGGGGWYGNRNLSYVPAEINFDEDIKIEEATALLTEAIKID